MHLCTKDDCVANTNMVSSFDNPFISNMFLVHSDIYPTPPEKYNTEPLPDFMPGHYFINYIENILGRTYFLIDSETNLTVAAWAASGV